MSVGRSPCQCRINPGNRPCGNSSPPRQITSIGEAEWRAALRALAPISESYLRDLLRETGPALRPAFAGIRQKSFAELERDLREMLAVYHSGHSGRRPRSGRATAGAR